MRITGQPDSWTAPDGTRLDVVRWVPAAGIRARVVALHGLSCRAEDFAPLGEALAARGVSVAAWNLRGQGMDPVRARRGAWLEVDGMLADLAAFAGEDDRPLFLCGESMGALLAIQAASRDPWRRRLAGVLLFVPVVGLAQKNPAWIKPLLRGLATIAPNLRVKPGWFVHGAASMPKLTRVAARQHELATAPHRLGPLGIGFLLRMGALIDGAATLAPRLEIPVALFSAGHDAFLETEQTDAFFAQIASADKIRFHYAESFHQLLFELNTAQVVADAGAWIEALLERYGFRPEKSPPV